jgi:FkbM family methyltransferase
MGYSLHTGVRVNDPFEDESRLLRNHTVNTIFDVGAHIGKKTNRYRALFPSAAIYAFEPSEESFNLLKNRFLEDSRIMPQNVGVSDKTGQAEFHLNSFSETNSLFSTSEDILSHDDPSLYAPVQKVNIDLVTLDEFAHSKAIDHIDILKLDVQGAELLALEGAKELLKTQSISLIRSEVEFSKIYENQALFHEIAEFLHRFGYQMYNLYGLYNGPNGQLVAGDAIFMSKSLMKSALS